MHLHIMKIDAMQHHCCIVAQPIDRCHSVLLQTVTAKYVLNFTFRFYKILLWSTSCVSSEKQCNVLETFSVSTVRNSTWWRGHNWSPKLVCTTIPNWRKSPMMDTEQVSEICVKLIFWIDTIPDFGGEEPEFRSVFVTAVRNWHNRWWRWRQRL